MNRLLKSKLLALSTCIGLTWTGMAHAELIVSDWKAPGDGLVLWDTETGLDWLNLHATKRLSFNEVTALLGSTYQGFRYADLAEVGTFFSHAGVSPSWNTDIQATAQLVQRWGIANTDPGSPYVYSMAITSSTSSMIPTHKGLANLTYDFVNGYAFAQMDFGSVGSAEGANLAFDIGSALVRTHVTVPQVPEPSTYALMLAGLAGVAGLRWRRGKKA